jgi:tetratricopeptide (TPR) repeat protein
MMRDGSRKSRSLTNAFVVLVTAFLWLLLPVASVWSNEVFLKREGISLSQVSLPAGQEMTSAYVHGLFLEQKGDYRGAIENYRQVMRQLPGEPAVKYAISRAYAHLAMPDSAKAYGEDAVKLDSGNRYYLFYLAGLLHQMHDPEGAADLYGRAALLEPERTDALYRQGLEYLSANQPERALEVFRNALHIYPKNQTILAQSLIIEIALGRYDEAIITVGRLLEIGGSDRKLRLTLADLYARNGQGELALQTIYELIDSDRNDIAARSALFNHYIMTGNTPDYQREVRAYLDEKSVTRRESDELLRYFVTRSGKDSLYVEPARFFIDEVAIRRPRDADIELLRGMFQMMHNHKQEGLASFRRAISFDAGNVTAWEFLITAHFDLMEKRKAFDLLAEARKRFPRRRLKWQQIEGYMLLHSGSYKEAATVLEKVVSARERVSDTELVIRANLDLALAYEQLGMRLRTLSVYERVLDLDAHNTVAMNNLAYILAEEGRMLRKAFQLASNAVMLEPENGVFLDTLGWVHYKLGNYEVSRRLFEKAIAMGTQDPEIYQHLGQVYRKLGDEPKAEEMFRKAKKVNNR